MKELNVNPLSSEVLSDIKAWFTTCATNHPECGPASTSSRLPTRVLDVGFGTQANTTRLKETEINEQGAYVALSHCWGTSTILKTTNETILAHMDNIEWHALSKTFQDAVIISRALGIQYLWIDSLCIVQGDAKDWEIESANMEAVYSQAYLVIAATAAPNGSHGCCFNRPRSHTIEIVDSNSFKHTLCVRETIDGDHFSKRKGPKGQHPLLDRAWAFQGRLLGCRVLHYCEKEIIAECKTATWCECSGWWGVMWAGKWMQREPTLKSDYHKILKSTTDDKTTYWPALVRKYMEADLTYHSDRLVAISSLAKEFWSEDLGQYLAGHWEVDLIKTLLWWSMPGINMLQRGLFIPECESAYLQYSSHPSWSWFSSLFPVGGARVLKEPSGIARAQLVESKCVPQNAKAPFGSVSRGEIILSGVLLDGSYDKKQTVMVANNTFTALLSIGDVEFRFNPDRPTFDDERTNEEHKEIHCLWMWTDDKYEYALVLEKISDTSSTYRRIGLLHPAEVFVASASDIAVATLPTLFSNAPIMIVTIV